MKLVSIVGARPNFIKLAPLAHELEKHGHEHIIIHTGQHYDENMSESFFTELSIHAPDYNLNVKGCDRTQYVSRVMPKIQDVLLHVNPDMVIIYGDTNSSLAGALVAGQNGFPIAHVEAGVRCDDMTIAEHFNRAIIDRVSRLNFCSTRRDHQNLIAENLGDTARWVGDIMLDIFLKQPHDKEDRSGHVLVTLHRAENVDDPAKLREIVEALNHVQKKVIWPIHPRTRGAMAKYGIIANGLIELIEPQSYTGMCRLVWGCDTVVTDSGGVQKEAYWAMKPCIVLLDDIVWPDIFKTGNQSLLRGNYKTLPKLIETFKGSLNHPGLFGNGDAAQIMVRHITEVVNECR